MQEFSEPDSVYDGLLSDPALLEREVWQLFELDLGIELGTTTGQNRWVHAQRLADEERFDRQRLLDASLDALMRDFRPSGVGWYAFLHEALGPTREERLARLDRYLALVTSPAPAVVRRGRRATRAGGRDPAGVVRARRGDAVHAAPEEPLGEDLCSRACKRHPDARGPLLEAAAQALAHERSDVQERALKLSSSTRTRPPARFCSPMSTRSRRRCDRASTR